jgi:HNH endonuclease
MKNKIEQIKGLLAELENAIGDEEGQQFTRNYNALELPGIISSIVDFLHPLLTPYEIAVYWHLFNLSIVRTGEQYARASTRGMSAVAKSASGKADELSYGAIKKTIDALKEMDVLSVTGDTNREGTLYKVAIPDEIPLCKELMSRKANNVVSLIETKKDLDFYNVAENRKTIFERDGYKCHYCSKQLTRFSATLDHIQPVSKGGDNSFDNLITACLHCNAERGNKPVMDFITNDS